MLKNKRIISLISCLLVAIAAVCVCFACGNSEDDNRAAVDVLDPTEATEPTAPTYPVIENFSDESLGLTGFAKSLLKINKDVVGWIKIDNTQIDYPVVQWPDPEDDENGNDYYLHRDLNGDYYEPGTIFMDYRDNYDGDTSLHTDNILLYGHNMRNGSMFGELKKYRRDKNFYDENPIIEFNSNYKDYQYIIIGYFVTSGEWDTNFRYWDIHEFNTEDEFDYYIDTVKEKTEKATDIDVKYGDKLLTLSTCHLDIDNSRFIVVARRLRDNETVNNIDRVSQDQN